MRTHFWRSPIFACCVVLSAGRITELVSEGAQTDVLLRQLKSIDSVYEAELNVSGSYIDADWRVPEVPPVRQKWHLAMHDGKIAYEEEVVEVLDWKDVLQPEDPPLQPGLFARRSDKKLEPMMILRSIDYVDDTAQANYHFVGGIPPAGVLPPRGPGSLGLGTSASLNLDAPSAPTHMFGIKRALFSIGRGYAKHITNITSIRREENGLLSVSAEGVNISNRQGTRWELLIDPEAALMVRAARMYQMGGVQPTISVENSGLKWFGSLCVPEKTKWQDMYGALRKTWIESQSASTTPDLAFMERARMTMQRPYPVHTDVMDERMRPELLLQYRAGEMFPEGQRGQEEAIAFEGPGKSNDKSVALGDSDIADATRKGARDANLAGSGNDTPKHRPAIPANAGQARRPFKVVVAWVILVISIALGAVYFGRRGLWRGKNG